MKELERSFATGDLRELQTYRRKDCACTVFEQRIQHVYGSGGHIEGTHFNIQEVLQGQTGPTFSKVTVSFTSTPDVTVDNAGRRTPGKGARGDYYFLLVRDGNRWIIDYFAGNATPT